jgi:malate/lactate dehydrogenase
MVTINGIAKHGMVNTYNRLDVLFAGIMHISGLKRDDEIPENMTITTKLITDVKYYGGES